MDNWIKVEDQLPVPSKTQKWQVYSPSTLGVTDGFYWGESNAPDPCKGWSIMGVTHYQPLPEPPKAKFLGDKMAVQCEPCAENSMADHAFVVEAMDFYWRHFKKELSRNDLGDIERKQYELIENRLKEYIIKHTE